MISVLSHLDISISYPALTGNQRFLREGICNVEDEDTSMHTSVCNADGDTDSDSEEDEVPLRSTSTRTATVISTSQVESAGEIQEDNPQVEQGAQAALENIHEFTTREQNSVVAVKQRAEAGFLKRLSDSCRQAVRMEALNDLLGYVYDNINPQFKVAEQILGRKDSVENGTCATASTLYTAKVENMKTDDFLRAFVNAPPLRLADIVLTPAENKYCTARAHGPHGHAHHCHLWWRTLRAIKTGSLSQHAGE